MVTMFPIIRSQARLAMTSAFLGTMPCQPLMGKPNQLGTMGREGIPTKSMGKNIICRANHTWNGCYKARNRVEIKPQ